MHVPRVTISAPLATLVLARTWRGRSCPPRRTTGAFLLGCWMSSVRSMLRVVDVSDRPGRLLYRPAVRLSAWELDCHASADQHVAGQSLCAVVAEYPLRTDRTPSIGHAPGRRAMAHAGIVVAFCDDRTIERQLGARSWAASSSSSCLLW
jgi:hypothetical protein